MHLTKLQLKNFRVFRRLRPRLDPCLNVFVGTNGVGMSSIISPVAILSSMFLEYAFNLSEQGNGLSDLDIANGEKSGSIRDISPH